MPGLTAEQRSKLLESIRQWGQSQDRIQGEQDHQAALAATLKDECGIAEKHFKRLAKAYWADTVKKDREDAEAQLDLFEQAKGFDAPTALNGLIEGGLVPATYTRGEALQ